MHYMSTFSLEQWSAFCWIIFRDSG